MEQISYKPAVIIRPVHGWTSLGLLDIWEYRELLYFLVWRDIKVRYKQTALGVGWVVLQPIIATLVFSVIFGNLAKMPSNGLPYPVFALAALLPWNYFASALSRAGTSLVSNAQLISKIYFPRMIIPLAGVINMLFDFAISFLVLVVLLIFYRIAQSVAVLTLPYFLLLTIGSAFGVSLWLAAINVRYRDVNYLLPFLLQVWMYATPVVFPLSLIPERWRTLYGLNPMGSVVVGFRWAMTGQGELPIPMVIVSTVMVILTVLSGIVFFRRTERTFADIV